jgi:hypothetical protein
MRLMDTPNCDKLSAAKLLDLNDITQKEIDLIESLEDVEIDAIISAGVKFQKHAAAGEKTVRVIF